MQCNTTQHNTTQFNTTQSQPQQQQQQQKTTEDTAEGLCYGRLEQKGTVRTKQNGTSTDRIK